MCIVGSWAASFRPDGTVVLLLDIPTGWEPRAKQSRTVALLAALRAAALFESSRRTEKEKPVHIVYWFFLVRPGGFEPLAFRVGAERSIQLSYDRIH